jgi:hypothetical protein
VIVPDKKVGEVRIGVKRNKEESERKRKLDN